MSIFYRMIVYLLAAMLMAHLIVRYAEAGSLNELKQAQCSQSASVQVGQTEIPVDEHGNVLRSDLPEDHPCKLSSTLGHCGEILYMKYFEQCMVILKDLPYIHN